MMVCNKLCDEHTIAGSLSNLADGQSGRDVGEAGFIAPPSPIHSLSFWSGLQPPPPFTWRSGCMLPVWGRRRMGGWSDRTSQPASRRPQATIITGSYLLIAYAVAPGVWALQRPSKGPPSNASPNLSCPGSVGSTPFITLSRPNENGYSLLGIYGMGEMQC